MSRGVSDEEQRPADHHHDRDDHRPDDDATDAV